jgi:hypothetical protein
MVTENHKEQLLDQLRGHGDRRAEARATAKREMAAIEQLAPKLVTAGVSKIAVAAAAQISRPALDTMLKRGQSDSSETAGT